MAAKSCPRDEVAAVEKIMTACQRPGLAENAEYVYNRGGTDITGATVDLMTVIANSWGNIDYGFRELSQANGESHLEAYAWDLETNSKRTIAFTVPHKRFSKQYGLTPLIDPRDVYENNANNAARRMRKCLEDIIPTDIVEDARKECAATLKAKAEVTPDAIAKMLDCFEKFSVSKDQIQKRLGRRLEAMQPAQLVRMRAIHKSLQDGMSEVGDWFEATAAPEPPKTATESAKAALKAQKTADSAKTQPSQSTGQTEPIPEKATIDTKSDSEAAEETPAKEAPKKPATAAETTPARVQNQPGKENKAPAETTPVSTTATAPRKSKSMTPEGLKEYMRARYEEDCGSFDMDRLARIAAGQPNPMGYIDLIITKQNPNYKNFELAEGEITQEAVEDGQAAEDVDQATGAEEPNGDKPECITNPLARPPMMGGEAIKFEANLIGKRISERIRAYAQEEIKNHPQLMTEECAYLLDLAERRAWQLEHGLQTTDRLPK